MDLIGSRDMPVADRILKEIWEDWRTGHQVRKLMSQNAHRSRIRILHRPNTATVWGHPSPRLHETSSITLSGNFIGEEDLVRFTDTILPAEDKIVVLTVLDHTSHEIYFSEFSFDGYELSLVQGTFSLYAFILDPTVDQVIGVGYPHSGNISDPNPVFLGGEGPLNLDFLILDVNEFEYGTSQHLLGS
ncbi:MAG: hypothetical protein SVY53_04980 [Chloroflexota bacterium]|nr:hypothetical protein [Chloroflexota bacterium]